MSELLSGYIKIDFDDHILKQKAEKYLTWGLILAAAIHLGLVGLYWGSAYFGKEEAPTRVVRIMKYSDLGPPPSISGQQAAVAPSVSVAPAVKPSVGIPVPVPDAEVSADQTLATQEEMSQAISPVAELAQGAAIEDIQIEEDDVPPPDFVPFEKEPVVIRRVEPVYPEFAKKAGLEGSVYVNIWVDKEGKVRDVKILKSDSEIFDQPVIDACKQWLFSPAMMKNGPVAVWVAVPFRFSLQNTQ
jgi:protein TonB